MLNSWHRYGDCFCLSLRVKKLLTIETINVNITAFFAAILTIEFAPICLIKVDFNGVHTIGYSSDI